jgi:hypothetical protein
MAPRLALLATALLVLTGCESTQDKAAALRAQGKAIVAQKGLELTRTNHDVEVVGSQVLHDQYGTAAIVELKNTTSKAMVGVPVAIDVTGAGDKSLFRNDAAGADPSLVSAALLPPGQTVVWVNNQVAAAGAPKAVSVKVGDPKGAAPARVPQIRIGGLAANRDSDGPFITGTISNPSKIPQLRLTVYGVGRKGGKVVAAGRAVIDRLNPNTPKPVRFTIYFIGDPKGAKLDVFAPPVTLR